MNPSGIGSGLHPAGSHNPSPLQNNHLSGALSGYPVIGLIKLLNNHLHQPITREFVRGLSTANVIATLKGTHGIMSLTAGNDTTIVRNPEIHDSFPTLLIFLSPRGGGLPMDATNFPADRIAALCIHHSAVAVAVNTPCDNCSDPQAGATLPFTCCRIVVWWDANNGPQIQKDGSCTCCIALGKICSLPSANMIANQQGQVARIPRWLQPGFPRSDPGYYVNISHPMRGFPSVAESKAANNPQDDDEDFSLYFQREPAA